MSDCRGVRSQILASKVVVSPIIERTDQPLDYQAILFQAAKKHFQTLGSKEIYQHKHTFKRYQNQSGTNEFAAISAMIANSPQDNADNIDRAAKNFLNSLPVFAIVQKPDGKKELNRYANSDIFWTMRSRSNHPDSILARLTEDRYIDYAVAKTVAKPDGTFEDRFVTLVYLEKASHKGSSFSVGNTAQISIPRSVLETKPDLKLMQ